MRRTSTCLDWIELIPFGETRDYVQRVLEGLQVYRRRVGDTQLPASIEQDLYRARLEPVSPVVGCTDDGVDGLDRTC